MKAHQILAIILRVFSLFLVLTAIRQSWVVFQTALNGEQELFWLTLMFSTLPTFYFLTVSWLLWKFPVKISKWIVREDLDGEINGQNKEKIVTILVVLLGLYIGYFALSDAAYWLSVYFLVTSEQEYGVPLHVLTVDDKSNMIATALEIVYCFILIFKSKQIVRFVLQMNK